MSQFNAPAYDIERPTGQCAFTGRTLEPGELYVAALVEVDEAPADTHAPDKRPTASSSAVYGGLKRLDVSLDQWDQGHRPDRLFSYWKTRVPEPNAKRKLFVDDDVLMTLFRRLEAAEQAQRLAFRFVLCLILMRKKLLRYDSTLKRAAAPQPDGSTTEEEWWLVTPKADVAKGPLGRWSDEQLEVLNPQLDEAQVQQVTRQLGEVLEAEL